MPIFTEMATPTNLADIDRIESLIQLKLPVEYIEHMLKYNGGKCSPDTFSFIENGKTTNSSIDWFLAIYDGEYDNLEDYIRTYKIEEKRLPHHIIPIAHDALGNLICISCGDYDYGNILFWDHENEVDYTVADDYDYSNLYLIAKSFNQFLNNLVENPYI